MTEPPVKDAATIVLLRPARHTPDPFEIYLVRRHPKSGFGAGMWVFPGGKVDDGDCADDVPATGLTEHQAAAILGNASTGRARGHFVAAIRETFEEAGVLLAAGQTVTDTDLQSRFNDKQLTFADVLAELDATADLGRLRYLDHWVTPKFERRRFSARFFVAEVPEAQDAAHDARETTDGLWITAARALERYADENDPVQMMPPTIRTLQVMATYPSIAAALDGSPHGPVPAIEPQPAMHEGTANLVLDGDPLHPTNPGAHRARFRIDGRRFTPIFDLPARNP